MKRENSGILITNIGTPAAPTKKAVRIYLKEFLSDRRVVEIPRAIWWPILYGVILPFRSQRSAKLYQTIWTNEGSPLLTYSKKIAESLEKKCGMQVELGMNYGTPNIATALNKLKHCEHIFILPLYPQYSATTTASTFDRVSQELKSWRKIPSLQMIHHYATNDQYISVLAQSIKKFREKNGSADQLLFSFHGIPEAYVKAGDPYAEQCHETAKRVAFQLKLNPDEWTIAFQSRLGRAKWLSPYTDQVLKEFPKKNISSVQVVCPGFAVDCLETLEEIAIRGQKQFLAAGGKKFQYIPALNDSEQHVEMLASMI